MYASEVLFFLLLSGKKGFSGSPGQLLSCAGCKALCMVATVLGDGLIQGTVSREEVVVVVMVT